VGTVDSHGRPWASILRGKPGFLNSPHQRKLELNAVFSKYDPATENLRDEQSPIGLLGIELTTRRRNRMNGFASPLHSVESKPKGFSVEVVQAFGNCPKYIQTRESYWEDPETEAEGSVINVERSLTPSQVHLIECSDTFFIASAFLENYSEKSSLPNGFGVDVSHRGGVPGFVSVELDESGKQIIRWPDFSGNRLFNTLGNILETQKAGVVFIDFDTSSTLQITGNASIMVLDSQSGRFERITSSEDTFIGDQQRIVELEVVSVVELKGSLLPLRFSSVMEASPFNPLWSWSQGNKGSVEEKGEGIVCVGVKQETHDTKTYYFAKPTDQPLLYMPGQFGSFLIPFPHTTDQPGGSERKEKLIPRTWTISSTPGTLPQSSLFSITVKKQDGGLISPWLFHNLSVGSRLFITGVGGEFRLSDKTLAFLREGEGALNELDFGISRKENQKFQENAKPKGDVVRRTLLFVGGGSGITPLMSMIRQLLGAVGRGSECDQLEVVLVYSVRSLDDVIFGEQLRRFASLFPFSFRVSIFLTRTNNNDYIDYDENQNHRNFRVKSGRVTCDGLEESVPELRKNEVNEVYVCGPLPFMNSTEQILRDHFAFDMSNFFTESFLF